MPKLCFNSRDELLFVDLEKVAYIRADGNYVHVIYIEGSQIMLPMGISKLEEHIRNSIAKDSHCRYVRIGRSLIINQRFLVQIDVLKQTIVLSDFGKNHHTIASIPKQALKAFRDFIKEQYSK